MGERLLVCPSQLTSMPKEAGGSANRNLDNTPPQLYSDPICAMGREHRGHLDPTLPGVPGGSDSPGPHPEGHPSRLGQRLLEEIPRAASSAAPTLKAFGSPCGGRASHFPFGHHLPSSQKVLGQNDKELCGFPHLESV